MQAVLDDPDILHSFLLYADYEDVINYCRSYKLASQICRNHFFWQQKAQVLLNVATENFNNENGTIPRSPALRYLKF